MPRLIKFVYNFKYSASYARKQESETYIINPNPDKQKRL